MSTQETNQRDERDSEFIDRLVFINRVSTVVKGGRRFSFAALVVVGDQKGHVGFGHGKAREVPEAIKKATDAAKATMIKVPLKEGRTLHHDIEGRHGAGKVIFEICTSWNRNNCRRTNESCFRGIRCSRCCC